MEGGNAAAATTAVTEYITRMYAEVETVLFNSRLKYFVLNALHFQLLLLLLLVLLLLLLLSLLLSENTVICTPSFKIYFVINCIYFTQQRQIEIRPCFEVFISRKLFFPVVVIFILVN